MATAGEAIQKIVTKIIEYGIIQKFPYTDDEKQVNEFLEKYGNLKYICVLIKKYLQPVYNAREDGVDPSNKEARKQRLAKYVDSELMIVAGLAAINGKPKLAEFKPTEEHKCVLVNYLSEIIEILNEVDAKMKQ